MIDDPIVEEVRAARTELWMKAGESLEGLFALLKDSQGAAGRESISLPPREPEADVTEQAAVGKR